jgi:CRP-like cAMP-binding protein
MTIERLATLLGDVDLLRTLDHGVLCDLAERVRVGEFASGTVLMEQGGEGDGLHLVLRGTAAIERDGVLLAEIGPGGHVGELALLDGGPRSATMRAGSDLMTAFLPTGDFLDVLESSPDVALELLVTLVGRFREVEQRLVELERRLV